MPKVIRQTKSPIPFTKETLGADNWKVVSARLSNEMVVMRYLVSKIVFTDEEISLEEISVLFIAFEGVCQKAARDKCYRTKYMQEVFTFRAIFQSLENLRKLSRTDRFKKLATTYSFYRGNLFSRRYFYSVKGQIQRLYDIRLKVRFPKKFAPKAYIGKGYGDNGTAKEPAYDGCLSWQEVAGAKLWEDVNEETAIDRENAIFKSLQVHRLQILK